ncbi:hypothetical protein [Streptomyces sp. NBC_01800]|uniref:hypothetical protein n=1 Tax=Streptomyces sp. NBC_01800 TaxID=2975945 RepID=UPI002DD8D7DB|nr:hypothetical protein [Streptomyces sp. NBC_01800]WSA74172.1 hypothetical protein OIE65_44700 [Streptomyces sp. NBC_01800]
MTWYAVVNSGGSDSVPVGASSANLPGRDEFRQTRLGLGQVSVEVLDLVAQFAGPGGGLGLPGLEICQGFDDVHAAATKSSRQAGAGVVRRRAMFAVDAQ